MAATHNSRLRESPTEWIRANRNLILFVNVILLIVMLPIFEDSELGEMLFTVVTMLMIVVAAATNGGDRKLFWAAVVLALPGLVLLLLATLTGKDVFLVTAWACAAAVLLLTIVRSLREIFDARSISRDTLLACANVYLLFGVLWAYLFAILLHFQPSALTGFAAADIGARKSLHVADLVYFSFNIVFQVALTNAVPSTKAGQVVVLIEELASVLYMAFVISRLVGLYAPPKIEVEVTEASDAKRSN